MVGFSKVTYSLTPGLVKRVSAYPKFTLFFNADLQGIIAAASPVETVGNH